MATKQQYRPRVIAFAGLGADERGTTIISVLFSTRNGADTLPMMLDSLRKQQQLEEDWEVIAVDNGSVDATASILGDFENQLPLRIHAESAPGKNRALNSAIPLVRGDIVVLTDDDVIAAPDWLAAMRLAATEEPGVGIFAGKIEPYWLEEAPRVVLANAPLGMTYALTDGNRKAGPIEPTLVFGPNMLVRRAVFDAGHRFDESIGPTAGQYSMGSETEFAVRVAACGLRCYYWPSARVQHIIRPEQVDPDWVIRRAYRFGRGQWDRRGVKEPGPRIAGVPRWRIREYLAKQVRCWWRRFSGSEDAAFNARWELSFLKGYLSQAYRTRRHRGPK